MYRQVLLKSSLEKRLASYQNRFHYPSIVKRFLVYLHDPERAGNLVAQPDEVIAEGLDRQSRVAGLGTLAVVGDEDGLFRLGDAHSCLALQVE
jgi:hypothetical protein